MGQNLFYQDWMKQTTLNPLGLAMLVILGICVLFMRRRYATIPFLVMGCFIPQGQNIVMLGLSFYLLRTLGYIGVIRCVMRREYAALRWNSMDTAVAGWAAVLILVGTFHFGTSGLTTLLGWYSDSALLYFVFRCLVRDIGDIKVIGASLIVISIPVSLAFLVEHATHRNPFAAFGGVPLITEMREGRLRCQGAFAHPILAGCFWAGSLPLIASLWWQSAKRQWFVMVGVFCCLLLVVLCASATPVTGVVAAVIGALLYRARRHMSGIRWGVVIVLIGLHLVMKAPVWSLVQRIDIVGGATGNFRYRLIDAAINHFGDWCLMGLGGQSTASWGWGLGDVTNQYVVEGINGGALGLALFIAMFAFAFGRVGKLWRSAGSRADEILYWGLGVALFVHCVNFIAIAYFGQILMLLFLQLAVVASLKLPEPVSAQTRQRRQVKSSAQRNSRRATSSSAGQSMSGVAPSGEAVGIRGYRS